MIHIKGILKAKKLQEAYHTFLEFCEMLFLQAVYLKNLAMTLNILDTTTMILTITKTNVINYVIHNPLADVALL